MQSPAKLTKTVIQIILNWYLLPNLNAEPCKTDKNCDTNNFEQETMKKRRSYDALDLKMETSKVTNVFHSVLVLLKRHVYIRAYKMVSHTFPMELILTLCFDILTPNCPACNTMMFKLWNTGILAS
jgi:hypothetical protein